MTFPPRFSYSCVAAIVLHTLAGGQSVPLVSKSIPLMFGVADRIFAFSDITGSGQSFSRLDLFANPPVIQNGTWPWSGGAQAGVPWRESLLLRSDVATSDTTHVARVASLFYDGKFYESDSLFLPLQDTGSSVGRGTGFTALAVWHDTLILGFGRLGIAYAPLKLPETGNQLFTDSVLAFSALPSGADTALSPDTCVWQRICRVDTLRAPPGGLDSVIALVVDSSAPDSIWLLVATQSGLRRGLIGSRDFPRDSLPGVSVPVQGLSASPNHKLLWAFTATNPAFFSNNHGANFHIPDSVSGVQTPPSILISDANPPQAAFSGDSTIVNFNLKGLPGLVMFKRDTLLKSDSGTGLFADVLDTMSITITEGSLTTLAVADSGNASILAVGTTAKGIFYRRLDRDTTFSNLNRLNTLKGSLNQIITFPTLFGSEFEPDGVTPVPVHIGYRLNKDGNVTITVFNYAMEKVRTVVKSAPRHGGVARSENSAEDQWDGKDASGRYVSVGTYYILVESDQGERGFGKALCVRGRK